MKKFGIALLGTAGALCLSVGFAMSANTSYVANADETTQDFFSTTKYKVSTDENESKMLLVTAVKDVADVYEVGYDFSSYTVTEEDIAQTTKYYDTLTLNGVTEDAVDIFGDAWEGAKLVVWEVANTENVTFTVYAKVGVRNENGDLTKPEQENKVVGTARNNQKYTVTFVDEYGTVLDTQSVYNGKVPTYTQTPTKEETAQYTYAFAGWDATFAPVTGDITYTANYTETLKQYTLTFEDCENLQTMKVDYGTPATALNDITPTKNGYNFVKWQVLYNGSYIDIPEGATVTTDMTVKAVWEKAIVYYGVKYFGYNGAEVKAETVEEGEKLTAPEAPALYNATFQGWYDESLTVEWNFDQDTVNAETKLYAKYTRTDATATEFESFDSELSILNVKTNNNGVVSYSKDEIDGVKGSAKFVFKSGNSSAYVIPRQNLTGYDYISFKLYIPSDNANADRYVVSGGVDYYVGANEWATITVPVNSIISTIDGNGYANLFMLVNDGWSGDFFATHRSTWEEVVVYVADVNYVKATTLADNVIVDFADGSAIATAQASFINGDNNNKRIKGVLTSKDVGGLTGAKLAYSIINEDGWNPLAKVKPAFDKAHYQALGYTQVRVMIYIPVSDSAPAGTTKKFPVSNATKGWKDMKITVGEWTAIEYSLDDFFYKYDSSTGYTTLFMVQVGDNKFANTDFYIAGIKAFNNKDLSLKENNVVWYADANNTVDGFRAYSSLVYFDGAMVLKCPMGNASPSDNKNKMMFKTETIDITARETEWKNAGYTKVQMRVYIPSANLSAETKARGSKTVLFGANTDMKNGEKVAVPLDQWYTYEMDIHSYLTTCYNSAYNYLAIFGAYNKADASADPVEYYDANFDLYFDSIRLA